MGLTCCYNSGVYLKTRMSEASLWIFFGLLALSQAGYNYPQPQPQLSETQSGLAVVNQNPQNVAVQPQPALSESQSSTAYQQAQLPPPTNYFVPNQGAQPLSFVQAQGNLLYQQPLRPISYLQFLPPGVQVGPNLDQNTAPSPILIPNFQFQKYTLPSQPAPPQLQLAVQPIQQQGAIVTKNVYVHVAPEEPPLPPQVFPVQSAPRKNYKIIFIKAPSQSSQRQVIHVPAQPAPTEEKTLVYVLVDKPQQPQIVVPSPAPTQASKPEVYFIKYKANSAVAATQRPVSGGESTSSLFSGAASSAPSAQYGPPEYQKRSA